MTEPLGLSVCPTCGSFERHPKPNFCSNAWHHAEISPRLYRQYRAAAWDTKDGTRDTGIATSRELAEKDLKEILNAEPPYDQSCIQTRLVSDWECCDD